MSELVGSRTESAEKQPDAHSIAVNLPTGLNGEAAAF